MREPRPIQLELGQAIKRQIAKGVTITNVAKSKYGLQIEGSNPSQDFVGIWTDKGKQLGMILRVKGEEFWSVYVDYIVITKPIPKGCRVIGSKDKTTALRLLRRELTKTKLQEVKA